MIAMMGSSTLHFEYFLLVLYEAKHNGIVLHVNFPIPDGKFPSLLFSPCGGEIGLYTLYMENEF
jgi:hypothetical protein